MITRCNWCNPNNPKYIKYHDEEWGIETHDDKILYELLILESFQAGLSWECILNKREYFKEAYDNFDINKIINYDDNKIDNLLKNKNIIRNKLKIKASITNSKIFYQIQKEYKSFDNYLSTFTNNKIIYDTQSTTSHLAEAISKDLTKRGMKYVGPITIHSYLQAIGRIYSHQKNCYLYKNNK